MENNSKICSDDFTAENQFYTSTVNNSLYLSQHPDPPQQPAEMDLGSLTTDLYQITMAAAYFRNKQHKKKATFELFFRKCPFNGEFCIFAGLEQCLEYIKNFKISAEELCFLRETLPHLDAEFFDYLSTISGDAVTVDAISEGTIVFPRTPLITVTGDLAIVQLMETSLLVLVNYASLVATNAARHKLLVGFDKQVFEFGLRRAQGPNGALTAARNCYVGGCDGTSNVRAGQLFGIPVKGTHAHSFVTSFRKIEDLTTRKLAVKGGEKTQDLVELALLALKTLGYSDTNHSELAAFVSYAITFPDGFLALVDTYNTLSSGVPNFLAVASALDQLGYRAVGIRLDSGDLAELSKRARDMFRNAAEKLGLPYMSDFTIVASDGINEKLLNQLNRVGHEINVFGIGTNLVTCQSQPALGCVYKLVEIDGEARVKMSENPIKISIPGRKRVFRLLHEGKCVADVLVPFDANDSDLPKVGEKILLVDPCDGHNRFTVKPDVVREISVPVWKDGGPAKENRPLSVLRDSVLLQLQQEFNEQHLRTTNDAVEYPVFATEDLCQRFKKLLELEGGAAPPVPSAR